MCYNRSYTVERLGAILYFILVSLGSCTYLNDSKGDESHLDFNLLKLRGW